MATAQPLDIAQTITDAANQYGVDPDFALRVARAESSLNPAATSSKGALGVMQLMPDTAKTLGVDPHDVRENIIGGVKYLRQLSDKYGDPQLVAAAYNAGPGAVDKHGGVPPFPETHAFVQKVTGAAPSNISAAPTPSSNGLDYSELDKFFGVNRGAPAQAAPQAQAAPKPQAPPPISYDELDKHFGVNRAQTAAPQQSDGYNKLSPGAKKVYNGFSNVGGDYNTSAGDKGTAAALAYGNTNSFGLDPFIAGAGAAADTALSNLGHAVGLGPGKPYSAGEAFEGTRQAYADMLSGAAAHHPMATAAGTIGGFATGELPALGAHAAQGLVLRAAPKLATNALGRVGARAAGTAGVAGATAFNEAGGQGKSFLESAAEGGEAALSSVPFSLAGEGAAGLSKLVPKGVARAAAAPVLGGITGGAANYALSGGNPGAILPGVGAGALGGVSVEGALNRGKAQTGAIPPKAFDTALDLYAKAAATDPTVSPHTSAAETFGAAPHQELTTAEVGGPKTLSLVKEGTAAPGEGPTATEQALEARHTQHAVYDRTASGLSAATGTPLESAKPDVDAQIALEREGLAQQVADSPMQTMKEVRDATGVDPVTAQMDIRDQIDAIRQGPGRDAYTAALKGNPVWTPELAELAKEPEVRRQMDNARRLLGSEAMADNPNLKTTTDGRPVISAADYQRFLKTGDESLLNGGGQPAQVPTDRMWDLTKQLLDKSVTRNALGAVEPSTDNHLAQVWSGRVRDATNEAIPGLEQARATYGEPLSWDRAYSNGQALGSGGKGAETSDAFNRRWAGLTPGEQAATRNGYLANMYRQVEGGRFNPETYKTPFHDIAQRTMFGEEGARGIRNTLARETMLKDQARSGGLLEKAAQFGVSPWSGGTGKAGAESFAGRFASMSTPEQEMAQKAYLGELHRRVQEGKFDPEAYLDSPLHKKVVETLFGKERAQDVRAVVGKEAELAASAKATASSAKRRLPKEQPGEGAFIGGLGVGEHGLNIHSIGHAFEGAAAYKVLGKLSKAMGEGKLGAPGVRSALDQIAAQPAHLTAKQLRMRGAEMRDKRLGESTLKDKLARSALRGLAAASGVKVAHALNGIGDQ